MSNPDTKPNLQRWAVPVLAVVIGVAYLVGGLIGDNPGFGVFGLLVMLGTAAVLMLASRKSETIQGLLDRKDERIRGIDNDASIFSGMVLIVSVIVGFVVEIARGNDGYPYSVLAAIAGVAYIVAVVFLRIRR
jgi:hypothetical protein